MFPKYVLLSICAFIRVHFGRPGKFHSIHPSGVYTFFQKLVMISEFFQRKVGSHLFSKACWFFSLTTYFLFFHLFPYLLSSFPFVLFSISFSFLFFFYFYHDFFVYFTYILLDDVPKRRTLHGSRISNIIDSNDI